MVMLYYTVTGAYRCIAVSTDVNLLAHSLNHLVQVKPHILCLS